MPLERKWPAHPHQEEYKPFCPHYPACYGCPFIGLPYPEQLKRKRRIVAQALAAYPTLAHLEVPLLVPSPHRFGYRARVKLVVRKAKDEVLAGIYAPESHQVVDISSCPVHPNVVNRAVQYLKREVQKLGIIPYDERNDSGQLRYLDMRYSFWRRDLLLTLVTRHADFPRGRALAQAMQRRFPSITGIVQNINEERGNVIWGERFRPLAGRDTIMERIGFLRLKLPAGVFSQANPPMARRLYETVVGLAGLSGQETVLDLYCGVGPLSFYLATASRLVWGVDENLLAISTAKENARLNGFHNCRFFVGEAADKVREAKLTLPRIDLVVLNPPRKGVNPEALTAVLSLQAPKIIYVSCDPATLTRDLDRLAQQGYHLLKVQPFDMFPQTEEVETIALLERVQEADQG
jgi:23S rRNA (uracil-5-)-methyltransferase RumA